LRCRRVGHDPALRRTSLNLSFSSKLSGNASLRCKGSPWTKVIGSDANAAAFNLGVTYAMSHAGDGAEHRLTPDAPDYSVTFKIPYTF